MKILVITMNVGRTAPGIVFERLIHGLAEVHDVDIITSDLDPKKEFKNVDVIEVKKKNVSYKVNRAFVSLFSLSIFDWIWYKKVISETKKRRRDSYDLIFSFISFNHHIPLMAGDKIAKQLNLRHFVYLVDAIPAPIGWLEKDMFYKGTKRFIAKYLSKVDGIFSANSKMLDYQLSLFKPKKDIIKDIIYNPIDGNVLKLDVKNKDENSFLYTGGIYGPRKVCYVLTAFKKVLEKYPNSILEFVGTKIPENELSIFNLEERAKVQMHDFAKDLTPYYERATALLDIDADLPNDIFLSSKITNYLTINRLIITETGSNSPSRTLFKGVSSILQCGHDVEELVSAMEFAIESKGEIDFNDRRELISIFDLKNVIEKINFRIQA